MPAWAPLAKTDGKQKRIAGKKKSHQQTGFGEYDPEKSGDSQRTAESKSAREFEKPLGVIQRLQKIYNGVHWERV